MSQNYHFIRFQNLPLMYGRVPKVANSSIKASLCRFLQKKATGQRRTTSDAFWDKSTNGETEIISKIEAWCNRGSHFCFSFVRNPFDRLVSAYNNKVLELDDVTGPMHKMGLHSNMSFNDFLECTVSTSNEKLDIHLLPQSEILYLNNQLIPNYVGRIESIKNDWIALQSIMRREGLPPLGKLPEKNRRRSSDRSDLKKYFNDANVVRIVSEKYSEDIERFYPFVDIDNLIEGITDNSTQIK